MVCVPRASAVILALNLGKLAIRFIMQCSATVVVFFYCATNIEEKLFRFIKQIDVTSWWSTDATEHNLLTTCNLPAIPLVLV